MKNRIYRGAFMSLALLSGSGLTTSSLNAAFAQTQETTSTAASKLRLTAEEIRNRVGKLINKIINAFREKKDIPHPKVVLYVLMKLTHNYLDIENQHDIAELHVMIRELSQQDTPNIKKMLEAFEKFSKTDLVSEDVAQEISSIANSTVEGARFYAVLFKKLREPAPQGYSSEEFAEMLVI